MAFALAVEAWGYSTAWLLTGVLSLGSVALLLAARERMAGHGPQSPQPAASTQDEPATDRYPPSTR